MSATNRFTVLVLMIVSVGLFAQTSNESHYSPVQLKKVAEHFKRQRDYYLAIQYYERYLKATDKPKSVSFDLAMMYWEVRDYHQALHWFTRSLELNDKKYAQAWYYQGRMHMSLRQYEQALESFRNFRKNCNQKQFNSQRSLARTLSEGCEMALTESTANPNTYLTHLKNGINMAYTESAPMPANENQFIFASLKSDSVIHYYDSLYKDTAVYKNQFYLAAKEDGEWHSKGSLKGPFNHPEYEVGNGCFDAEGTKFYFTRCKRNWKYQMICQLYVCHFEKNQWTEPVRLEEPVNLSKYSTTQPTMGYDPRSGHEVLYFVSDRPRGRGGTDIWYTELKKGEYTEPRNCGGRINTEGNEVTPYYHLETNTLFFSSDGHVSYGELDIFKSFGQKSKWMKNPENLGLPINSSADDTYFILHLDPKEGFFTSNREGGIVLKNPTCCDDIYSFVNDEFRRLNYQASVISKTSSGEQRLNHGTVDIYLRDKENSDTTFIRSVEIGPDGNVEIQIQRNLDYLLIVKADQHFNTPVKMPKDTQSENELGRDTIYLERMEDRSFVLENIYYDFDDWHLRPESEKTIDEYLLALLELNPTIKIELSSHTDNKGGELYNLRLSQKRAESVAHYLKKKGITRERIIPKGYGQSKPIAPNTHPDGSDNPEGRQLNRRTEFKIIGK